MEHRVPPIEPPGPRRLSTGGTPPSRSISSRPRSRSVPTDTRRSTGIKGEEEAARFLTRSGYAILDKNVRTRAGEIDLVAKEGKTLVFVEVKTRRDAPPIEPEKHDRNDKTERG